MNGFGVAILQITLSIALVGLIMPAVFSTMHIACDSRVGLSIVGAALGTIFTLLRCCWWVLLRRR